jgi:hypothetical protein
MLGNLNSYSIPSYSKAPRGLFVLLQVDSIFTVIAISPGSSSRQFPTRYAFDAGQNLPDKEFRYLRTIIVIADVHRRFGDWLAPLPLTFRHWSGVTPYTSPCGFAESCVFGKQSVGKLSLRPALRLGRHIANVRLAFLPSSLTKNLPFTLGYSPSLPVSDCSTDTFIRTLEVFPGTLLCLIPPAEAESLLNAWAHVSRICLRDTLTPRTPIQ